MKRDNKQFFAYMKDTIEGSNQYVRHIANKPPARLTVPYEKIRFEVAQELRILNAEEIENEDSGEEKQQHPPGGGQNVSAETRANRELEVRMVAYVDQFMVEGKSQKEACIMVGIKQSRYKLLKSGSTKWFEEFKM